MNESLKTDAQISHWQHKCKCLRCGLHFTAYSDFAKWPMEGTTREQRDGEATGLIYCPECGSTEPKVHWVAQVEGFIFQYVPGNN